MDTEQKLREELEEARRQLTRLTEEAERNSDILARSQARELTLLQAEDLASLFSRMVSGLRDSYALDAVTVVLCDPDHDVRHLLLAGEPSPPQIDGLMFVDSLAGLAPQYVALRSPWLGRYSAPDHQLLFPGRDDLASVAIIPLRQQERLFGSINFGSRDASRFSADQASDFLAHLGNIASFALENSVNRARLLRSGFTDVLTGWYNRRYLQVRLMEELARARRHGSALTCLMLDIDHFKRVNDRYGHAAGDDVLRELTQQIESKIRATDVAARYGGEEFLILLPDTDAESGFQLAERIRAAIAAEPFLVHSGAEVPITVSIGVACVSPQRGNNDLKTAGDALVARADVALYAAKSEGRNRVSINADN
jgi:diguanylate cyclase (GGDEF)-like protein